MSKHLLHVNIHETELSGGGKKSAGTYRVIANQHGHLLPDELTARLAELIDEGYRLTITVLATRDKRKAAIVLHDEHYMIPRCDRHNCPEYATAMDRLSELEQTQ
ncbi:MAG: hypothetical protein IT328_04440 [Caldilineaceae bacterium]|nr:hypothetical protein [Caldilineaceae bacterium]